METEDLPICHIMELTPCLMNLKQIRISETWKLD